MYNTTFAEEKEETRVGNSKIRVIRCGCRKTGGGSNCGERKVINTEEEGGGKSLKEFYYFAFI